jgi:tRNA pseudouridine38-40 synthase
VTQATSGAARCFRLVIAYDGTAYAGWQAQPDRPAIQSLLTHAARELCGPEARVSGASRTDAGVHALRQTVSLTAQTSLAPAAVLGALNAALPRDVRVTASSEAPPGFHARRSALGKRYVYLVDNGQVASPLLRRFAWHVPQPLDVRGMRQALSALRGRHDFSAFRAAAGASVHPVCAIRALHVFRRRDCLAIWISADRFLHHMVRVIVGSAVEVGRGARPAEWLGRALASRERRLAGPTAPATGLVLVRVLYPRDHERVVRPG